MAEYDHQYEIVPELLAGQALRFFIFDFILFKKPREKLEKKSWLFRKLFSCPFCNGFWTTVTIRSAILLCEKYKYLRNKHKYPKIELFTIENIVDGFITGIVSGFLSITWYSVTIPCIEQMEKTHAKETGWIQYQPIYNVDESQVDEGTDASKPCKSQILP